MSTNLTSLYTLIPFLPLAAFMSIAFAGRWIDKGSHRLAISAMAGSFAISVVACIDVITNEPIFIPLYTMMEAGTLAIGVHLYLDALSALLLLLVTGISTLVYIYSSQYMQGDQRYAKFFALISLFTFSMIMLVLSNNLLILLVFWEIMGICSYFLIGFWAERPSAIRAATKAFLVNAVADIWLGLGIIITFATFGTLDIPQVISLAPQFSGHTINLLSLIGGEWHISSISLICLFFFMGAMGKSAQLPFQGWLPSAMEAPSPVSALIHAATMVNAGVYLVIRMSPMFLLTPSVMTFVAIVGGTTALFAGSVALTQTDIKRILAFSTISQLGFMMFACGVGAFAAAVFHLIAHGTLKAYLFLSTGNSLNASAARLETHNVRKPPLSLAMWALVLSWLPLLILFSGPYETLWTAVIDQPAGWIFISLGGMTVFLTAYYTFKLITSIFQQPMPAEWRVMSDFIDTRPHIAAPSILALVAMATVGLALVLAFTWNGFAQVLSPVLNPHEIVAGIANDSVASSLWMIVPFTLALAGWSAAYYLQIKPYRPTGKMAEISTIMYVLCLNRWYADELYHALVVKPTLRFSHWLWQVVELRGIDRVVNEVGRQADTTGQVLRKSDRPLIQQQMLVMIFWLAVAIVLFYWVVL